MATSQQIQFAETIRAMKLALKRKADDSDSDTSIHAHTNRGNKLKRRAKSVREGHLDTTGGSAYRKKANHAGYTRNIIATNPPFYDEDGDLYSPTDSDAEHNAAPLEDNAFGDVQLETLLRPLTSPAELADHPSLSLAYKSKALTELTKQAEEMVRRERAKLWRAKRLLRRFLGDTEWVPCGVFEAEQDEMMLVGNEGGAEEVGTGSAPASILNGDVPEIREDGVGDLEDKMGTNGDSMKGVEVSDMAAQSATEQAAEKRAEQEARTETSNNAHTNGDAPIAEDVGRTEHPEGDPLQKADPAPTTSLDNPTLTSLRNSHDPPSEETSTSGRDAAPSHSMTTRARARSPANDHSRTPSPTPSTSTIPPVHPWYLVPPSSLTSLTPSLNLPPQLSDTTRQLLLLYVQRQEHSVRLLSTLYTGLQRADRLRREVWRSAKADAHVGELSDGEDWYDVQDWGLVGGVPGGELKLGKDGLWGLEKGKDEVDEVGGAGGVGAGGEEEGRRGGRGRRRAVRI